MTDQFNQERETVAFFSEIPSSVDIEKLKAKLNSSMFPATILEYMRPEQIFSLAVDQGVISIDGEDAVSNRMDERTVYVNVPPESADIDGLREQLGELGFPATVLNLYTPPQIASLAVERGLLEV